MADADSAKPVRKGLVVWLSAVTGLNAVIVDAFVQRSPRDSSFVVLCLAGLAALGVYGIALSLWWGLGSRSRPAALVAPALVLVLSCAAVGWSFRTADAEPADEIAAPPGARDTEAVALRGLQFVGDKKATAVSVEVVNRSSVVTVVDHVGLSLDVRQPGCSGVIYEYALDRDVRLTSAGAEGGVRPRTGPLARYQLPTELEFVDGCAKTSLAVGFDTAMSLPPHDAVSLVVELPRRLKGKVTSVSGAGPFSTHDVGDVVPLTLCFPAPLSVTVATTQDGGRVPASLGHRYDSSPVSCQPEA